MSQALRNAQRTREEPDDEQVEFLETSAGANWRTAAADALVQGHDQKAGVELLVSTDQLYRAATAMALRRVWADEDNWLGQMLVAIADYNIGHASHCMKQLLGPTSNPHGAVNALAEELLTPHAEKAAEAMRLAYLEDCP